MKLYHYVNTKLQFKIQLKLIEFGFKTSAIKVSFKGR